MGDDLRPVNAARISFGNQKEELDDRDKRLINYLAKHQHYSPFEHCQLSVLIKCPLYTRSQLMRHRTFAYNEISRRYTTKDLEFYVPEVDDIRKQSTDNKQCSEGLVEKAEEMRSLIEITHNTTLITYNTLIDAGVSREQARGVLPQNLMTEFYMTGNLRNWIHFLKLRLGKDAQKEAQYVAQGIEEIIKEKFPKSYKALMK